MAITSGTLGPGSGGGGSAALPNTNVGVGNSANVLSGTLQFTFNQVTGVLTVATSSGQGILLLDPVAGIYGFGDLDGSIINGGTIVIDDNKSITNIHTNLALNQLYLSPVIDGGTHLYNGYSSIIIANTVTFSSFTVQLDPAPVDGQIFLIRAQMPITTFIFDALPHNVVNAVTTFTGSHPGTTVIFSKDAGLWYTQP